MAGDGSSRVRRFLGARRSWAARLPAFVRRLRGAAPNSRALEATGARSPGRNARGGSLRVAFASHTSQLGGAERNLLELVSGLRERGVVCLVVMPSPGPLLEALARAGVGCRVVRYSWWSNPVNRVRRNVNNLLAAVRLGRIFRAERIDLVCSSTMTIPSAALAAKLCRLPHIWRIHEFGDKDHELRFDLGHALTRRLIGALSARVVCVSEAVKHDLSGYIDAAKLSTVYGSVAVRDGAGGRRRAGSGESRSVHCVLVGVLRRSKGQHEAIEALALLLRRGLDVRLTLVGAGPDEGDLRRMVALRQLAGHVRFAGYVDDPAPLVEDADIVLLCSRCEAFARAVLEAMALGRPVVGSRSGGTVEAVREGFNGLLYAPGDVDDLADKIHRLAADPDYARRLGENGRSWSRQRFTREAFVDAILRTMEGVMAEAAARAAPAREPPRAPPRARA